MSMVKYKLTHTLNFLKSVEHLSYNNSSAADIEINCAFCDKSMKFGTHMQYGSMKLFSYRAIVNLSQDANGGHFSKWPPPVIIFSPIRHRFNVLRVKKMVYLFFCAYKMN